MAQHINEILVRIYEHGVVDEHAEPHYFNEKPNDLDPLMLGEAKQQILTDLLEMSEIVDVAGRMPTDYEVVPMNKIKQYFQGGEDE